MKVKIKCDYYYCTKCKYQVNGISWDKDGVKYHLKEYFKEQKIKGVCSGNIQTGVITKTVNIHDDLFKVE